MPVVNFEVGVKLSYDDLVFHLTKECPNVRLQCNSCKNFFKRKEFVEHNCYLAAQQIDNDILVQRRSELIQIFLEIQKINSHGIDLFKCFTEYQGYKPIPSKGLSKPGKEHENPQSWRSGAGVSQSLQLSASKPLVGDISMDQSMQIDSSAFNTMPQNEQKDISSEHSG